MACMLTCFYIVFLIDYPVHGSSGPGRGPLTKPLYVINITAVKVDNTSLLVSWGTIQRINSAKFCRLYQEGTTRSETFTWTLQILKWPYFNNLTSNSSYEDITFSVSRQLQYHFK